MKDASFLDWASLPLVAGVVGSLVGLRFVPGLTWTERLMNLAGRVLAKSAAYSAASGTIIGARQRIKYLLDAAQDADALAAVPTLVNNEPAGSAPAPLEPGVFLLPGALYLHAAAGGGA
ncbi:hypothetical protein [Sphingomonas sp.]|uniref:hypothetical protein n=1 Tax=Sphingomonas sp. TaxID=28214 RepID=UPI0025836D16|nr:hypothetical protein [Sphingomonas sp.]